MKKLNSILVLGSSAIIILALIVVHDYTKPDCAEAGCVNRFGTLQTQTCNTILCDKDTPCFSASCSMLIRSNQACFLRLYHIGDIGGGGQYGQCRISGTTVVLSAFSDHETQCGGICFNLIP